MVERVVMYRTANGGCFDNEAQAIKCERRELTEERLVHMLRSEGVDGSSTLSDIAEVIICNRDEILGALYYLENG